MNTDDILKKIGEFGKYQFLILLLVGLTSNLGALSAYAIVFMAATPEHRCAISMNTSDTFEIQNRNHELLVNKYIAKNDHCHIRSYLNESESFTLQKCNKWVYSKKYYDETIVTLVLTFIFFLCSF